MLYYIGKIMNPTKKTPTATPQDDTTTGTMDDTILLARNGEDSPKKCLRQVHTVNYCPFHNSWPLFVNIWLYSCTLNNVWELWNGLHDRICLITNSYQTRDIKYYVFFKNPNRLVQITISGWWKRLALCVFL